MKKGTRLKNFIKVIIICITAAAILAGSFKVLVLKSEDGINQMQALYRQPKNSVDVIFLGSSLVYCDISTGVLWDNHGIAAFDLGSAEAPAWASYYELKEALRHQRPKAVCYEVSISAIYDMLTQSDEWSADANYGMRWTANKIHQLKVNSEKDEFLSRLDPFNIMHGRYTDLKENDFTNVRDSVDYKGFDPREYVQETERPDMDKEVGKKPCTPKAEEYIKKIIQLTREEDIPLIMFVSPYSITDDMRMICNYIKDIAASEGVEFIDFNERYDEMSLDFSKDMSTGNHLNYEGNYKFSDYFGQELKKRFDIPDRRGDERYVSWDRDAAWQRNERTDLEILGCESAEEALELTQEGYVTFLLMGNAAQICENNECMALAQIEEGGEPFRLLYTSDGDSFCFEENREDGGEPVCSIFINDKEYKPEGENFMLVYDLLRHEVVRTVEFSQ